MAIVFALLIIGWLVAFALGNQVGFSNEEAAKTSVPAQAMRAEAPSSYSKPASVS